MDISYESFNNLEEDKKQKIINAGYKIFAENGFKKASVDEIVKEANISKGSLFYYFESKKNFFLFLYEYSGEQLEKLVDKTGEDGMPSYLEYTDFFERLNAIQLIKMKHGAEFPCMYSFLKRAIFETTPTVKAEITKVNERYTKERAMAFFQNLDYSKFKEGIDPAMIIQLITWCSEGCANQILLQDKMKNSSSDTIPDFKEVFDLYQSYMDLFRKNFYKKEYL